MALNYDLALIIGPKLSAFSKTYMPHCGHKAPVSLSRLLFRLFAEETNFHPEFKRHCIGDNRKHIGNILKLFVVTRKVNIKFNTVFRNRKNIANVRNVCE